MGRIQLAPLTERLENGEIDEIRKSLKERGAGRIPDEDESETRPLADGLDEDILRTFLDQLDDHDIACEIYLPVEFEGRFEIGDIQVGSAHELLGLLEELKDEFEVEEDEEENMEAGRPEEYDPEEDEEDEEDVDL